MSNVVPFPQQSAPDRLGRYRLISTLGQGGMGTIHLAVAGGLGGFRKLFVVKELKAELTHNAEFLRLFMREARLAARLTHANVVHTIEADHDDGRYFLAMEFLDGQPLSEILRRAQLAPAVPLALRLQLICQALIGLHHAHELRDYDGKALEVVHRDVSPTNIFVTYDGQVKVLDFGIARAGDAEGTQPQGFKGKIGYAAPEQLRMRPSDRRVDVFAAGVVLWEAIALRHLVRGKLTPQVFEARMLGTELRIGQVLPDLDPALAQICDRAMCVDPDQRYPTAEAFRMDLQNYLTERALLSDATVLAELMRSKFAVEQKRLHSVIEDELANEEDFSHSFVATRDPLWFPPARVNAVSGHPPRADEEESKRILPAAPKPKSLRRFWIAALLLTAAAWAFRLQTRDEAGSAPPAPTEQNAKQEKGSMPAAQNGEHARGAPNTPPPPSPSAPSPKQSEEPDESPASARALPTPRESARFAPPSKAPKNRADSGNASHGGQPRPTTVDHDEARSMDVDLRGVRPATRRTLDLDNPFR